MRHIGRLGILTILFAAVLPAQPARGEGAAARPSADEGTLLFQEIPSVYGASKYEQKVTDAPSSVSIVTADEIRKYGYRTLADVLGSLRGFYTTYDRNYHYLGVRGFGPPGDYNTRILLLVDGIRQNDNVYDMAAIGTDFPVDVDLIDRVEVIRGPSSSLYGTSAFFAVVNVITKRGRDTGGLQVSGEAGSFQTYKGRLTYGDRFSSGLEVLGSGTVYRSQGDDDLSYDFYPESGGAAAFSGTSRDNDEARLEQLFGKVAFGDFTLEGFYSKREKHVPTGSYGTVFDDGREETHDPYYYADLKYDHSFEDRSNLTARTGFARYWYHGDFPYAAVDEEGAEYTTILKDPNDGRWWYADGQYVRSLFEAHRVSLGGELRRNYQQEIWTSDDTGANLYKHEQSTVWALYAQDELSIADPLKLSAGVRHDHYSTFGGSTNPRLALLYSPFDATTLKLLYGRAFRAPNAYELYYEDGVDQKAAKDLDPETIESYELVLEQGLGAHLRAVAAAFYYEVEDLIVIELDPSDDLKVLDNGGTIFTRGLELELEGKWPSGLEGRISYAYQISKASGSASSEEDSGTGSDLANSPRHLAKLNLIVPVLGDALFSGLEVRYTSRRLNPDPVRGSADDSVTVNLTLFTAALLQGLELSATVYNLFDNTYEDPSSLDLYQYGSDGGTLRMHGIEQDGRTFRVKATYTF